LPFKLGNLGMGGTVGVKQTQTTEQNWICQFAIATTTAAFTHIFGTITRFAGGVTGVATASVPYTMPNNEAGSVVDIYTPSGVIAYAAAGADVVFDFTVNDIPQKVGFSAVAGNVANGAGRAKILKPINIPASFPFQPTAYTTVACTTAATQTFVCRVLITPTK
jgi:hypothetical protein